MNKQNQQLAATEQQRKPIKSSHETRNKNEAKQKLGRLGGINSTQLGYVDSETSEDDSVMADSTKSLKTNKPSIQLSKQLKLEQINGCLGV